MPTGGRRSSCAPLRYRSPRWCGEGRARELRGIGRGIEARLRELVETGEIAELAELRRSTPLELVALGRLLGFGAQRALEIGAALGISTADELRLAAREGRLREVPGIGPKTEAKIVAALEQEQGLVRRVILLPRARALTGEIATALGGHAAGDARRWVDEATHLAVVVASDDPAAARERFAELPEIVAMLDADTGLTADGIPIELVIAPPAALGTALVRATGPRRARGRARLAAHGGRRGRPVRRSWVSPSRHRRSGTAPSSGSRRSSWR